MKKPTLITIALLLTTTVALAKEKSAPTTEPSCEAQTTPELLFEPQSQDDLAQKFTDKVIAYQPATISTREMKKETGVKRCLPYVALQTQGETLYSEMELFTDNSDLIIGVATTGNTRGHMYLIINGVRMDGRMFFAPQTEETTDWKLSKGLVIRYKNMPPENKQMLADWLATDAIVKGPSCVAVANKILYRETGFIKHDNKIHWFPSTYLKYLALHGLQGVNGERLTPEIYTLNADIHDFWNNLPTAIRVPGFIFKVLFDPYTWQGRKKAKTQVEQTIDQNSQP
jgi:hypothetical protein